MWNRQTGFPQGSFDPAPGLSSSVLSPTLSSRPAQCLDPLAPVEVVQAVHVILAVQGKALIPDAPGTGHTREAGWVEGLAQGPDDVFSDHLTALATLLQGVLGQRAIGSEPSHVCAHSVPQGASDRLRRGSEGQEYSRGAQIHAIGL